MTLRMKMAVMMIGMTMTGCASARMPAAVSMPLSSTYAASVPMANAYGAKSGPDLKKADKIIRQKFEAKFADVADLKLGKVRVWAIPGERDYFAWRVEVLNIKSGLPEFRDLAGIQHMASGRTIGSPPASLDKPESVATMVAHLKAGGGKVD